MSATAARAGHAFVEVSLRSKVKEGVRRIQAELSGVSGSLRTFGTGVAAAGATATAAFGSMLAALAWPAKAAADLETIGVQFEVMTGSARDAKVILAELQKFAASTPFDFPGLAKAAQTLLAYGISNEKIMPAIRALGDVSGGSQEKLERLAVAFGQTQSKGKLMAQEVNQMVENGFNPLQEISRTTGMTMKQLFKEMEDGNISADMVSAAFVSATRAGGNFFGMMDRQSQTAIGRLGVLRDSVLRAVRPIGEALLPVVKDLADKGTALANRLAVWIQANKELAPLIGKVAVAGTAAGIGLTAMGVAAVSLNATIGSARTIVDGVAGSYKLLRSVTTAVTASVMALTSASTSNTVAVVGSTAATGRFVTVNQAAVASSIAVSAANAAAAASYGALSGALIVANNQMRQFVAQSLLIASMRRGSAAANVMPVAGFIGGKTMDFAKEAAIDATIVSRSSGIVARSFGLMGSSVASVSSGIAAAIGSSTAAFVAGTALIAGSVAYVANRAGLIAPAFAYVKRASGELLAFLQKVFGGISTALSDGNYKEAAQILWAGVKVAFFHGLRELAVLADQYYRNLLNGLLDFGIAFGETIKDIFMQIPRILRAVLTGQESVLTIIKEAFQGNMTGEGSFLANAEESAQKELDRLLKTQRDRHKSNVAPAAKSDGKGGLLAPTGNQGGADTEEQKKAAEELQKEVDKRIESLREEANELRLGANAADLLKLKQQGATQEQLRAVWALQQQRDKLKAQKDAQEELKRKQEEAKKEAEDNRKELIEKGKQMTEEVRTPFQVFQDKMREIDQMLKGGFIDPKTAMLQRQRAAGEFQEPLRDAIKSGRNNVAEINSQAAMDIILRNQRTFGMGAGTPKKNPLEDYAREQRDYLKILADEAGKRPANLNVTTRKI